MQLFRRIYAAAGIYAEGIYADLADLSYIHGESVGGLWSRLHGLDCTVFPTARSSRLHSNFYLSLATFVFLESKGAYTTVLYKYILSTNSKRGFEQFFILHIVYLFHWLSHWPFIQKK
jgi:hypothetical protein